MKEKNLYDGWILVSNNIFVYILNMFSVFFKLLFAPIICRICNNHKI